MLSTLAWVPRGAAKQRPDMYEETSAAMAAMSMDDDASAGDHANAAATASQMDGSSDEDSDGGTKMGGAAADGTAGIMQKYNLQVCRQYCLPVL